MAVDKALVNDEQDEENFLLAVAVEDEMEDDGSDYEGDITIEEDDEGNVTISYGIVDEEVVTPDHSSNLAEFMDESDLTSIGTDLLQKVEDDEGSRKEWSDTYRKGMALLGLTIEDRTFPFDGASGVFHPIMAEAVVRFQSEAMMETFPASGPVKTQLIGTITEEKEKQAARVRRDMNYKLTTEMVEYRQEHENALFHLPLGGSVFKKVYYDENLGRVTSRFVHAEDFIVSYGTTDLQTSSRYTHRLKLNKNDLIRAQLSGQYRFVELGDPLVEQTEIEKTEDDVAGVHPVLQDADQYTLYEVHVEYDLAGFEDLDDEGEPTGLGLPYIITLDKDTGKVLSIYRDWAEDDDRKRKYNRFIQYQYMPGPGFYGIGLTHLLGGISKAATSTLRQLIDAGTLANLPAGFKAAGLRIKGDNAPLNPGEFRDVDVMSGVLKDSFMPLPYKEPSTVLHGLLGDIVAEGRKVAAVTDMNAAEMNQGAQVGTTLALIEQGMKVMSAVQGRLHAAMGREFRLIAELIGEYCADDYEYDVEEGATRVVDYDGRVDVVPVSDPNASTLGMRIMRFQALQQMMMTAPEVYDVQYVHRKGVEILGFDDVDKIVPMADDLKPMDPVAENMAIINSDQVRAFEYQDHEAHIKVHMDALQDPKIQQMVGQSPKAQMIMAAAEAHIREHVAFQYKRDIEAELGMPIPADGMPPETEAEAATMIAKASDKMLQKDIAEQQARENAQKQQDPVVQQQMMDAETKRMEVERKAEADRLRFEGQIAKIQSDMQKWQSEFQLKADKAIADATINVEKLKLENQKLMAQIEENGIRLGADIAKGQKMTATEDKRIDTNERLEMAKLASENVQKNIDRSINVAEKLIQSENKQTGDKQDTNKDEEEG